MSQSHWATDFLVPSPVERASQPRCQRESHTILWKSHVTVPQDTRSELGSDNSLEAEFVQNWWWLLSLGRWRLQHHPVLNLLYPVHPLPNVTSYNPELGSQVATRTRLGDPIKPEAPFFPLMMALAPTTRHNASDHLGYNSTRYVLVTVRSLHITPCLSHGHPLLSASCRWQHSKSWPNFSQSHIISGSTGVAEFSSPFCICAAGEQKWWQ